MASGALDGHFIDGGEQLDIVAAMAANKNRGCGLNRYNTFIPNKISVDTTTPLTAQPFNATFSARKMSLSTSR